MFFRDLDVFTRRGRIGELLFSDTPEARSERIKALAFHGSSLSSMAMVTNLCDGICA